MMLLERQLKQRFLTNLWWGPSLLLIFLSSHLLQSSAPNFLFPLDRNLGKLCSRCSFGLFLISICHPKGTFSAEPSNCLVCWCSLLQPNLNTVLLLLSVVPSVSMHSANRVMSAEQVRSCSLSAE